MLEMRLELLDIFCVQNFCPDIFHTLSIGVLSEICNYLRAIITDLSRYLLVRLLSNLSACMHQIFLFLRVREYTVLGVSERVRYTMLQPVYTAQIEWNLSDFLSYFFHVTWNLRQWGVIIEYQWVIFWFFRSHRWRFQCWGDDSLLFLSFLHCFQSHWHSIIHTRQVIDQLNVVRCDQSW